MNTFQFPKIGELAGESTSTKNNAVDGKVETILIDNRGSNYQPISTSFSNVPILGDGTGGKATITIDSFGKVSEVFVTDGGKDYTQGTIQFYPGAPETESGEALGKLSKYRNWNNFICTIQSNHATKGWTWI